MRDLKFRLWKGRDKMMVTPAELIFGREDGIHFINDWSFGDPDYWRLSVCDGVVMEFTGCKDSEGKDIYEGDIVLVTFKLVSTKHVVVWGAYSDDEYVNYVECWMLGEELPLSEAGTGASFGHDGFTVKVIGNIYENPELLVSETRMAIREMNSEKIYAMMPKKKMNCETECEFYCAEIDDCVATEEERKLKHGGKI